MRRWKHRSTPLHLKQSQARVRVTCLHETDCEHHRCGEECHDHHGCQCDCDCEVAKDGTIVDVLFDETADAGGKGIDGDFKKHGIVVKFDDGEQETILFNAKYPDETPPVLLLTAGY